MIQSKMLALSRIIFARGQFGQGLSRSLMPFVKTAADFEEAMAQVGAVSRASAEGQVRLIARARELGASTSFSASEVTHAQACYGWP